MIVIQALNSLPVSFTLRRKNKLTHDYCTNILVLSGQISRENFYVGHVSHHRQKEKQINNLHLTSADDINVRTNERYVHVYWGCRNNLGGAQSIKPREVHVFGLFYYTPLQTRPVSSRVDKI